MLSKIREEADEIEAALDRGDAEELAEETGDLLFALVNLARHVGADPESALRGTNAKFERRFAYIERALAAKGRSLEEASLEEMDALWNEAKGAKASRRLRRSGQKARAEFEFTPRAARRRTVDTTMSRLVSSTRTVMSKRPSCSSLLSTSALRCSQLMPAPSEASIDRSSVVRVAASRSSIAASSSFDPLA